MELVFDGDAIEWLNQIPECIIDQVIEILEIDPNKEMIPNGYIPVERGINWPNTAKICLWEDLVKVINRWGKPSPSQMLISPAKMTKHANEIRKKLSNAESILKSLEYSNIYEKGTLSKEFKFGFGLRQISELFRKDRIENRRPFYSPLLIRQEYKAQGVWGKYYPLDDDIKDALKALNSIIGYIDYIMKDRDYKVSGRGKRKIGKDNYDYLIWGLCYIYKKYTKELPTSSAREDGTATGKIIPFLCLTLSQSSYPYAITDWALEKKIRELKSHKIHGKLWQDAKN